MDNDAHSLDDQSGIHWYCSYIFWTLDSGLQFFDHFRQQKNWGGGTKQSWLEMHG